MGEPTTAVRPVQLLQQPQSEKFPLGGSLVVLQGGFLFSGVPNNVWKDPYVVGQNRKDGWHDKLATNMNSYIR